MLSQTRSSCLALDLNIVFVCIRIESLDLSPLRSIHEWTPYAWRTHDNVELNYRIIDAYWWMSRVLRSARNVCLSVSFSLSAPKVLSGVFFFLGKLSGKGIPKAICEREENLMEKWNFHFLKELYELCSSWGPTVIYNRAVRC